MPPAADKLTALLEKVDQLETGAADRKLAGQLEKLGKALNKGDDDVIASARKKDLVGTLNQIADRIR